MTAIVDVKVVAHFPPLLHELRQAIIAFTLHKVSLDCQRGPL